MAAMARVLLIDDDRKLLSLLERGFRFEGFDVLSATSGARGLALAQAERPDVVLLDIGMPDVDGYAVCRQLRVTLDVPVIMLTARDEVEDKVKRSDWGQTTTSPSHLPLTNWPLGCAPSCAGRQPAQTG